MKTIVDIRKEKEFWEDNVRCKTSEYDLAKKVLRQKEQGLIDLKKSKNKEIRTWEQNIRDTKKAKNKTYKELTFGKYKVTQLTNKIGQIPSLARKWGKKHPGEVWNKIEEGKFND